MCVYVCKIFSIGPWPWSMQTAPANRSVLNLAISVQICKQQHYLSSCARSVVPLLPQNSLLVSTVPGIMIWAILRKVGRRKEIKKRSVWFATLGFYIICFIQISLIVDTEILLFMIFFCIVEIKTTNLDCFLPVFLSTVALSWIGQSLSPIASRTTMNSNSHQDASLNPKSFSSLTSFALPGDFGK